MNKQINTLAIAMTTMLGATAADAAIYTATMNSVVSYSNNGSSAGVISSSTSTFTYDDVTNLLTQTGGNFIIRYNIVPTTELFRHTITGLIVGNGGAAAGTSFRCTEGTFGSGVGAHLCGNYNFGANYLNESTVTYGPGVATARTIAGDDMALGPQQQLNFYDGMLTTSWVGTTLKLSNATPTSGYDFTLNAGPQVIPVPAAVWLFGSALGLLGVARRKAAKA